MIGRTISHYRILEIIGEGGMGIVYKAEDTRLGRTVALKFPHLASDHKEGSRSRFLREAQATATLDHSSICHVYEFDELDGRPFFVMAYIEGMTLNDRIAEGPIPLGETLRIAMEIADGLDQAHEKEVIHRDIKTSNIIINEDGHAKILDFGLALMTGVSRITNTGAAMGTTIYMSPEQIRSEKIDRRTDIWSLGIVIYEMLTGQRPFLGNVEAAICYAILNQEPEPPSSLQGDIPPEMDWILMKCLAKDPEDRYGSAGELLGDLEAVHKKTTTGDVPGLPSWIVKRQKTFSIFSAILLTLTVMSIMVVTGVPPFESWQERFFPWAASGGVPQGATLRITAGETWCGEPGISPDGTRIVYVSDVAGNRDVYLVDAKGGNPFRLTDDPATDEDPAWFPDGHAIAFTSNRSGTPSVWRVGQLGGDQELLLPNAVEAAISADGGTVAFVRADEAANERIWLAAMDDLSTTWQLTTDAHGAWSHREPAWSPDGSVICYKTRHGLWVIRTDGSEAYPLTEGDAIDFDPVWAPDGRHVYFSSFRDGTLALWRVLSSGGEPQRLTPGTGPESHPSLSVDRQRIAYTTEISGHNLVLLDLDTGTHTPLPSLRDDWMPTISPDETKIVFVSDRWGTQHDLWIQELENRTPLDSPTRLATRKGDAAFPAFSPDGRWVAYYRILDGRREIMTLSLEDRVTHQVTDNPADDVQPTWSPDGRSLAFSSTRSGTWQVWSVRMNGGERAGEPRQLTGGETSATGPAWSPDGMWIAYIKHHGNENDVFVIPAGDVPQQDKGEFPRRITEGAQAGSVAWDPAAGELLIAGNWEKEYSGLRRFSLTGDEIGDLEHPVIFGEKSGYTRFAVSASGRLIVYVRQQLTGDVWLLTSVDQPY